MSALGRALRERRDVRAIRRGPRAVVRHVARKAVFAGLYRRSGHRRRR